MPERPLPPVVGATENALRALLEDVLSETSIGGYSEWVYLTIRIRADDSSPVEDLVSTALKEPLAAVEVLRTRMTEAGVLHADGSLTSYGRDQFDHGRELISSMTRSLTAGIDEEALTITIGTLDTIRERAEHLAKGFR